MKNFEILVKYYAKTKKWVILLLITREFLNKKNML